MSYSLLLTVSVFTLFLEIADDQNGEGNMELIVRERKSNSTSDHEVIIPSPNKKSTETESAEAAKVSAKSGCISIYYLLLPFRLQIYNHKNFELISDEQSAISYYYLVSLSVSNINLSTLLAAKLTPPPSQAPTPAPAPAEKEPSGGKNKFFLFKWFGFGSK